MNVANLDLNLLNALDAVLQQRSVTRAAQQLRLSQPAVSASLARLRRHFGDELLARTGNEYRLTPLAVELKDRAHLALASVQRVFDAQLDFDPSSSEREFSLILSDYVFAVLGRTIARLLSEEAPEAHLQLLANTPHRVSRANQVLLGTDLLIVPHGVVSDLSHQDLFRDDWVCLVSTDNARVGDELTIDDLKALPWVASFHGPVAFTPAELHMRMLGIQPEVKFVTESFLSVPDLVAGSDRIALLQRRMVDLIPPGLGIRALACPVEIGSLVEAMWWHPVYDEDPEHAYFRDVVRRAAEQVVGAPPDAEPAGG